jgi:hypothetical protein
MRVARHLLGVALSLGLATTASAQAIVYNNGGPNGLDGSEMSAFVQAEDFSFLTSSIFNGIRFWDIEVSPMSGGINIDWAIFTNAAGSPGSQLFGGTAASSRTSLGVDAFGFEHWQNDIAVGPVTLGPGTFWLALHEGSDFVNNRAFFWETTDPNGTHTGVEQAGGAGPFGDPVYPGPLEHAFSLTTTTPEPGTIILLATGLIGIGWIGHRRRAIS